MYEVNVYIVHVYVVHVYIVDGDLNPVDIDVCHLIHTVVITTNTMPTVYIYCHSGTVHVNF